MSGLNNSQSSLVQVYNWLRVYGLNDSHSGNASIRVGDMIWITPSGACADTLTNTDLISCHIDGRIGEGASLDAALHIQTYQDNAKTKAVLHSHNPHTLALTMNGEDFKPVDFEGAHYFDRVPVITIPYENYLEDSPYKVSKSLQRHKACVVRGHGVYVAGTNLELAYKWTCSLEHSAKVALLTTKSHKV
ncbi:MAG: class II aldolase/adducin family protein [Gammaproteobacteria bacterium]|nr:class II aldolase/adducin family protein [Gammaproteobacteria bacterium]NNC96710.1 class II aldolase/adducin family protein [Gammaproteobacteria bacterium]NNM14524.1 class II aldolase/adducin family protein [Gammaproteobacteria bacterium]